MNDESSVSESSVSPEVIRLVQLNVRVSETLKQEAVEIAKLDNITLQEFIVNAISEKVQANAGRKKEALEARRDGLKQHLGEIAAELEFLDSLNIE